MKVMKIYLAGPLFTLADNTFNTELGIALDSVDGFECLIPSVFCDGIGVSQIGAKCLEQLKRSDVVLVNCDGPDVESGTSFEAGWAHARGIPFIGYRTDFRKAGDDRAHPVNLMIGQHAAAFIVMAHTRSYIILAYAIVKKIRSLQ